MNDFEPKQFGKYLLLERLAVGGMAEIFRAKTYGVDGFEKELVIKRILPHCSADKDFIDMLVDEAKLSVLLSHANIVQVYDLSKVGDDYYIAMELIHGVNLRDVMYSCREAGVPIPTEIAVYIASEICKGLDYAHRKTGPDNQPLGIVHRDVSPQNILLSYEGEVKIVDFGIAKAAMNISHTLAGILKGKIAYMSPEQAMGKKVDNRTDIFSSGILLYEMLTGQKLFTGESQFEVLKKIRTTRLGLASLPDSIPEALKPIVLKALAYESDERYQHAGDFQVDLTKYLYSNHIDFAPRKLSVFIRELFADKIRSEQTKKAHERDPDRLTSTLNIQEGARQVSLVKGDEPGSISEITARTGAGEERFVDTMVTPLTGAPAARTPPPRRAAPREESITARRPKKSHFLRNAAALLMLIAAGYAAYRFLPSHRPGAEKPEEPPAAAQQAAAGSISVTSLPPGARILVDGADTGRLTPSILEGLNAGQVYAVRLEKEEFAPAETQVRVLGGAQTPLSLTLPAAAGTLEIESAPPGALIAVDGRPTGLTAPATIPNLKVGSDIRVVLSRPDFEDFEQVVTLSSSKPQKLSARLTPVSPQMGRLTINSSPAGAIVQINDKEMGRTTPAMIANLAPGTYNVKLSMEGYDVWSGSVEVKDNRPVPIEATLTRRGEIPATGAQLPTTPVLPPAGEQPATAGQPPTTPTTPGGEQVASIPTTPTQPPQPQEQLPPAAEQKPAEASAAAAAEASVKVTSTPPGARISLDGRDTGKVTPATLEKLKVGATVRVRLDLAGYKSATRKKAIAKPSEAIAVTMEKEAAPEPPSSATTQPPAIPQEKPQKAEKPAEAVSGGKPGTVKVSSNPSGADVFINSEFKGKTPLSASVPAGTAQVLVNLEGKARVSRTVTVKPGETVNLSNIELGELFGEVSLNSDPPAAQVIFDGQAIPARTPVTIRKVRRDRPHSVTIQMPGYKPWSTSFSLDSGSKSFNATLQPQ